MGSASATARRLLRRSILALAPAVLLGAYAWFPALAFVPYFALVPWVLLYADERSGKVSAGYYVFAAWVMWMALYPQSFRFGWYVGPVMGAVLYLAWIPFPFFMRRIHAAWRLPRSISFPVVWVALEWFRSAFTLSHFDIYGLGYSQGRFTAFVQIADVVGAYGVSFLVAAVNGWVADMLLAFRDRGEPGFAWLRARRLGWGAAAIALAAAVMAAYGAFRMGQAASDTDGPRIAVVQPNHRHTPSNAIGVHLSQVILTENHVPRGAADLIVWPENAILDNLRREGVYLRDLGWLAESKGAWMLVGAMGKLESDPGRTTNTASLIDSTGSIRGEYLKQALFPWSEYIPFDATLEGVAPRLWQIQRSLARRGWGSLAAGAPGEGMTLLRLPWNGAEVPFAALICVENSYPPIPAEAARLGARFFVNLTSEGEVSGAIQEQLLRVCILRAVETRMAYVRCGNTGISGFIDGRGRVRSILRGQHGRAISDSGVLIDTVRLTSSGVTLYARSRDAFALLCVAATGFLFIASVARRRSPAALAVAAVVAAFGGCGGPIGPASDPATAAAALEDGRARLRRGDFRGASARLASACGEPSACALALPLAYEAFSGAQEPELAAEFFEAVAGRHSELVGDALGYQGYFREKSARWRDAEALYVESLRRIPSARVRVWLASLRFRSNRPDEAIADYRRALQLTPSDIQTRYLLGRALWIRGQRDEAMSLIEQVLAEGRDFGGAWAVLGRLRGEKGDDSGADLAFRTAILVDPENVEARFMLARAALRAGRSEEFERWRREILAIEASKGRRPREG